MFDALLYCQVMCHVMADIRHGYFLMVADFVRTIAAQFRALWTARQSLACGPQAAWMQSLARLETYVDSMA
jgi:hypothetical protein